MLGSVSGSKGWILGAVIFGFFTRFLGEICVSFRDHLQCTLVPGFACSLQLPKPEGHFIMGHLRNSLWLFRGSVATGISDVKFKLSDFFFFLLKHFFTPVNSKAFHLGNHLWKNFKPVVRCWSSSIEYVEHELFFGQDFVFLLQSQP